MRDFRQTGVRNDEERLRFRLRQIDVNVVIKLTVSTDQQCSCRSIQ